MINTRSNQELSVPDSPSETAPPSLTPEEAAQLIDPQKQELYRREYLAQLRRRACPGCGETEQNF